MTEDSGSGGTPSTTLRPIVPPPSAGGLRTPRAAAIAGIAFGILYAFSTFVLTIESPVGVGPADFAEWYRTTAMSDITIVSLYLVPFAGIAFLWFIAVIRNRIGDREDRFFATVFLGSGLLFVAMFWAAGAEAAESRSGRPNGCGESARCRDVPNDPITGPGVLQPLRDPRCGDLHRRHVHDRTRDRSVSALAGCRRLSDCDRPVPRRGRRRRRRPAVPSVGDHPQRDDPDWATSASVGHEAWSSLPSRRRP